MAEEISTFSRGDEVPYDGKFICVPCGYVQTYTHGEKFGECISCLSGSEEDVSDYSEGTEMWEALPSSAKDKPVTKT